MNHDNHSGQHAGNGDTDRWSLTFDTGAVLPAKAEESVPSQPSDVRGQCFMFCPCCGAPTTEHREFCARCGARRCVGCGE